MKAERRHELKTNALLAWLSRVIPWMRAHTGLVLLVLLVVVGGVVLIALGVRGRVTGPRKAWVALSAVREEDDLRRLLDEHGSTPAAREGRLFLAAYLYNQNRLTEARTLYEQVRQQAGDNAVLAARALLGLATVAEQERRFDEALQLYRTLSQERPVAGYAELAKDRLQVLERKDRPAPPAGAFEPLAASRPTTEEIVPIGSRPATRPTSRPGDDTAEDTAPARSAPN